MLRKELGSGGSLVDLLGLKKLSFIDKIVIVGGIIILFFWFRKNKTKKE